MSDPDTSAIQHAGQWLTNHGLLTREDVTALASAAEDGDLEAEERLRELAEEHGVDWSGDIGKVAETIAGKIEALTEDDSLGNELE